MTRSAPSSFPESEEPVTVDIDDTHESSTEELDVVVSEESKASNADGAEDPAEPIAPALPDFDEMVFGEPTTAYDEASESLTDSLGATVDSEVAGVNAGKWATSASLAAPHLPTFDEILSGEVKIIEDIEDEDVPSLDDGNDMSTDVVPFDLNLYRSANGDPLRLQRRLTVLTVLVAILTVVVAVLAGLMAWWWFSPSTFLNFAGPAEVVFQNSYA